GDGRAVGFDRFDGGAVGGVGGGAALAPFLVAGGRVPVVDEVVETDGGAVAPGRVRVEGVFDAGGVFADEGRLGGEETVVVLEFAVGVELPDFRPHADEGLAEVLGVVGGGGQVPALPGAVDGPGDLAAVGAFSRVADGGLLGAGAEDVARGGARAGAAAAEQHGAAARHGDGTRKSGVHGPSQGSSLESCRPPGHRLTTRPSAFHAAGSRCISGGPMSVVRCLIVIQ